MRRFIRPILLTCIASLVAFSAGAVPVQITVQGIMTLDPFSSSVFDISDQVSPIQVSFVVESEAVTTFAAGTPITAAGASLATNAQRVDTDAISDFVASIGSQSFTEDNLGGWIIGPAFLPYDILLLGDLVNNGIYGAVFSLSNQFGTGDFGRVLCNNTTCSFMNDGGLQDILSGGIGLLSDLTTSSIVLTPPVDVPEPGTAWLLAVGLSSLILAQRRRSAVAGLRS